MTETLERPQKGQPIRAGWAGVVTDAVNAIRAAGFVGTLVRDGAGAFGNAPLPKNLRDRRSSTGTVLRTSPGCWQLGPAQRTVTDENNETVVETFTTFLNRYYAVGEVAAHLDEWEDGGKAFDVGAFIGQGTLEEGYDYTPDDRPYICLKVPAKPGLTVTDEDNNEVAAEPDIVGYHTFADMVADQRDTDYVVRPLYLLTHAGNIRCDFRATLPKLQMTEVLP